MDQPLLVSEDIRHTPRTTIFSALDIPWQVTPKAWIGPLWFLPIGLLLSFLILSRDPLMTRIWFGFLLGVLCFGTYLIHDIGHVLSGVIIGAPMDALLLTMTRHVNIYKGDQTQYYKGTHIGRAAGGPTANLLAAGLLLLLWLRLDPATLSGILILCFSGFNLAFGSGALLPIPTIDGWVIWGELLGFRQ